MREAIEARIEEMTACLNRHDARGASEYLDEDVLFWEPTYGEPRRGRDAMRRELEGFFAMLPDIQFRTLSLLANERVIAHEWEYTATYQGRAVAVRECSIAQLNEEGLVAEVRVYFDRLTLLRQLGMAPAE